LTHLVEKPINPFVVALGYNSNLDLRVNATALCTKLGIEPSQLAQSNSIISSLRDLQQTFAYYFSQGSAAERFVSDLQLFQHIVKEAKSLSDIAYSTGGNAALMANRFASFGCETYLGGRVGGVLLKLLEKGVVVAESDSGELEDEVHLIMEYEVGAAWGSLRAPRANRFILVHDKTNSQLRTLESFHLTVNKVLPALVILSGLHLVEAEEADYRQERLGLVMEQMHNLRRIHPKVRIHFELASVGHQAFVSELLPIIAHSDSLGLNEQELASLFLALDGRLPARLLPDASHISHTFHASKLSDTEAVIAAFRSPSVETVAVALKHVFNSLGARGPLSLTRIHFHYLRYHIVAERKCGTGGASTGPSVCNEWGSGNLSVAAGSLAATQQACRQRAVVLSDVKLALDPVTFEAGGRTVHVNPADAVTQWEDGDVVFYLSPVLVCRNPTQTVGLGDTISSTGLVYAMQ
jgi:ADP-dependent glucokinase